MMRCVSAAGRRAARCCSKGLFPVIWQPWDASMDILYLQRLLGKRELPMQAVTIFAPNLTTSPDLNAWTMCPPHQHHVLILEIHFIDLSLYQLRYLCFIHELICNSLGYFPQDVQGWCTNEHAHYVTQKYTLFVKPRKGFVVRNDCHPSKVFIRFKNRPNSVTRLNINKSARTAYFKQ